MIQLPKQMLSELFERQAAIRADAERDKRRQEATKFQAQRYAPTREVFEEFLKVGHKVNTGFLGLIISGHKLSRFNWKNQTVLKVAKGQEIVVKAFTDPEHPKFGYKAGNIEQALIGVKVSLVENPDVSQELKLPPVWAILEHDSDFSFQVLDKLGKDLEEIVPLVRACLSQD